MIPGLMPVLVGGLACGLFLLLWAAYSLRDFSRSRLDEICRQRGVESRFGDILRGHEDVLLAVELLIAALSVAFILLGYDFFRSQLAVPVDWGTSLAFGFEIFSLAVAFLFGAVVLPWTLARVAGEPFLARCWPLLKLLRFLLTPLIALCTRIDRMSHRLAGLPEPDGTNQQSITEEIRSVVDEGQREGLLHQDARTMIHRVIDLESEDVAAIMTPRTEMHVIQSDTSLQDARNLLLEFGHSRVPVIGDSIDDIVGILYAKDLLQHFHGDNNQEVPLREIVRDPIYVPDATHIDQLLERMKRDHVHIAIVIDEYSGVAGLVTMEDILEEIVGKITDEYDPEEEEGIRSVSPDVIDVEAWVHIDELNEKFDFDLPEEGDYETIAGFVFEQLGRVPAVRDVVKWNQLSVTVLEADERRILKVRIEIDRTLAATSSDEN